MINMQEQMQGGFANISRQIRALSSSLEPSLEPQIPRNRQISQPKQPKCDHRRIDKYDDEAEDDQDIEEIIPEYESDEVKFYYDETLGKEQEVAQKKFEKNHRKEIRVRFIVYFYF